MFSLDPCALSTVLSAVVELWQPAMVKARSAVAMRRPFRPVPPNASIPETFVPDDCIIFKRVGNDCIPFSSHRVPRPYCFFSIPWPARPQGLAPAGLFCLLRHYTGPNQQIKTAKRRHCLVLVLSLDGAPHSRIS